ncbi:MAG: threonine--tRNA ligase [Actinobacteria bacterium]|jgi:threonyl-tRNA synthetase|nr:threonine--tRNA ligase [Actinomycetota bacterium]MBT3687337.1 threonine--tRNA ligase [Actinomycetota bacterium]MBT4037820.1 threonine--tRNA ligase [Actinomycetota bacterium]MBT4278339.1 threonine--tRNA ligase [Actinomycetota bacterium]MBT4342888.1 threonine--tRNA ligase [Actinomycetota bacterium]
MADITLSLPDGSQRTLPDGATGADLALDIGPGLAKAALVATVDGIERDLAVPLPDGATVSIVTADSDAGLYTIRHSTAHVLAQAVLDLWPGATYAIGPPIDHGFYYDFLLPEGATFSPEDLEAIDSRMREIIALDQLFERHETDASGAMELFEGHPYKREIIEKVSEGDGGAELSGEAGASGVLSCYRNGDGFVDLCMGPHVPSTGRLGHFALQKVAGAYWRGDESQPMLQRIYGTAWASKKDLAGHLHRLIEAEKRDHRRLAVELDLVSWPESLGPGLAVWHPRGALIRKLIEDYSRERHEAGGYDFVFSPHIAKSILWETSGHLDFYADGMYPPMEMDGATYYPKPMNCPFHVTVFDSSQRSYRDLPLRYFELGAVYRYELSGAIHGLMRSRGFTQDDAHIFCTREQVPAELASLLEFTLSVLRAFGFDDFQAKLSTRPEGKAVGEDDLWEMATDGLRSALETAGLSYVVDEGGGAFYGPKIDVDVTDAIGRPWQLSTIQLDFNLPERFGLEYVGSDGERHRPVMIHRALMGSIERFFGVLLEHFAGAFPAWLAPEQVRILPVAAEHQQYAESIRSSLGDRGYRSTVVPADEPLGKRVRAGKVTKVPHILVVGDDDVANSTVGENARGADSPERDLPLDAFIERLADEVATRV